MLQLLEVLDEPSRLGVVAVELQTKLPRLGEHVAATRKLRDEHSRFVANHGGIDVLVGVLVFEHSRDVLTSLVRKRPVADERLLQWEGEIRDLRHRARKVAETRYRGRRESFEAELHDEVGDDRDEVCVSAALAISVD